MMKRQLPGPHEATPSATASSWLALATVPQPKQARGELREAWSKAIELIKLARRQGDAFESAKWLHNAEQMPFDRSKQEIERVLNGPDAEPWDLNYFKLYKDQLPVIEQALETAARMLGSDRSRGYCLEMSAPSFWLGRMLMAVVRTCCCSLL